MTEKNVLTEIREDIIIATLNRPEALNALNDDLMDELSKVVDQYEENTNLKCLILTGSEKAFAAGADIKQMQPNLIWMFIKKILLLEIGKEFHDAGSQLLQLFQVMHLGVVVN